MKKALLLLLVSLLANFSFSQNVEFPTPGLELGSIYHCNYFDGCEYFSTSIRYVNDTIFCDQVYHSFRSPSPYASPIIYMRYEDGKVYATIGRANPCDGPQELYYDFNLEVGDFFNSPNRGRLQVVRTSRTTLPNGEERKELYLSGSGHSNELDHWIDGIGDVTNGFFGRRDFEGGYEEFICARDNSGLLWEKDNTSIVCEELLCLLPFPAFEYDNSENTSVQFQDNSLNAHTWLWDFGDGTTSRDTNPVHSYVEPGCYEVCLTLTSPCRPNDSYERCTPIQVALSQKWIQLDFIIDPANQPIKTGQFINKDTGWIASSHQVWKTIDGGQSWVEQILPPGPAPIVRILNKLHFIDENTGMIAAGNYIYSGGNSDLASALLRTNDGGSTWEIQHQGQGGWFWEGALSNSSIGWASGQFRPLFKTENGGLNWQEIEFENIAEIYNIFPISGDTVIISGKKGVSILPETHVTTIGRTTDGENWTFFDFPEIKGFSSIFFLDAMNGWAVGGLNIYKTNDGGQSWETTTIDLPMSYKLNDIKFADANNGLAAGEKGLILHTTDGGENWVRENCGRDVRLYELSFPSPDVAYTFGRSGTILKYCPNGELGSCEVVTSTKSEQVKHQNTFIQISPNPFSHSTTLKLAGGMHGSYKLAIYDSSGQLIESQAYTAHKEFVLTNKNWPNGLYFVTLTSSDGKVYSSRFIIQQ